MGKNIYWLADSAQKLTESWFNNRDENPINEWLRISLYAANIKKDI